MLKLLPKRSYKIFLMSQKGTLEETSECQLSKLLFEQKTQITIHFQIKTISTNKL